MQVPSEWERVEQGLGASLLGLGDVMSAPVPTALQGLHLPQGWGPVASVPEYVSNALSRAPAASVPGLPASSFSILMWQQVDVGGVTYAQVTAGGSWPGTKFGPVFYASNAGGQFRNQGARTRLQQTSRVPTVPYHQGVGAYPPGTQQFAPSDGGVEYAGPAPAGALVAFLFTPDTASVTATWNGVGVTPISSCYVDAGNGCQNNVTNVNYVLDGTTGVFIVRWTAKGGGGGTYALYVPGVTASAQTIQAVNGGSVTADSLPPGSRVVVDLPLSATNTTVERTGGVSSLSQSCFGNGSPCALTLDGNPGIVTFSWSEPGQKGVSTFSVTLPGAPPAGIPGQGCPAGMLPNPAYYAELGIFGSSSLPACVSDCPAGQVHDLTTGVCSPLCWNGTAPNGGVCPQKAGGTGSCPTGQVRDPSTGLCVTKTGGQGPTGAATPTSTGTYVAIGAGILAVGGVLYYVFK